jgi:hypothetical protein
MALKVIDADKNFNERLRPINYYVGSYIREYVASGKKLRVNPDTIIEIVEKFTKAGDNTTDLHKVRLTGGSEFYVNDDGLNQLDVTP